MSVLVQPKHPYLLRDLCDKAEALVSSDTIVGSQHVASCEYTTEERPRTNHVDNFEGSYLPSAHPAPDQSRQNEPLFSLQSLLILPRSFAASVALGTQKNLPVVTTLISG